MSLRFGPIRQIGYVVTDIHRALAFWIKDAGVGPWFLSENLNYDGFVYRGSPGTLKLSVALANSGDMQLELIQPLGDTPSMFREFLGSNKQGMHHWCVWPEDYEKCVARGRAAGLAIGQSGTSARGQWVYFDCQAHDGTILEVAELTPARHAINTAVKRASETWDGKDAIRAFPSS